MVSPKTILQLLAGHSSVICDGGTMVWPVDAGTVQEGVEYIAIFNTETDFRARFGAEPTAHGAHRAYGVALDQRLTLRPGATLAGEKKGTFLLASQQRLFVSADRPQLQRSLLTIHVCVATKTLRIVEGDGPIAAYPVADVKVELAKNEALVDTVNERARLQQTADRLEQLVHERMHSNALAEFLPHAQELFSFFVVAKTL